jgi:hypothetical protein
LFAHSYPLPRRHFPVDPDALHLRPSADDPSTD